MKNRSCGGYFTIEATLVMPFVIMILLIFLFLGLFEYDRLVIEQSVDRIAIYAEEMKESLGEEQLDVILRQKLNEEIVGKGEMNCAAELQGNSCWCHCDFTLQTPFWPEDLTYVPFSYRKESRIQQYDPVNYIRNCRKVKRLTDEYLRE